MSFTAKSRLFFRKHPVIANILAICLTGLVLIWLVLLFLDVWTHHGDDSTVPEIKHLSYYDAKEQLAHADLQIEISDSIYDTSMPPGTIVESWPKAGSQVKRGRKVYVTLTAFSAKHVTLSMPVTGVSARQAISYLNALGVNTVRIVHIPSQYPDLVEGAYWDGRPVGTGSVIPVDASIVLEVGQYVASDDEDIDYDSIAPEHQSYDYEIPASGQSSYIDDEP